MLHDGYLRVARPAGVEVRLHWSVAVGALLSARLRIEPGLWLGFFGVLLAHELGHVAAVKSVGATLVGIDCTGFGGSCRWRGSNGLVERAWVAWGGVLAQAALLVATLSVWAICAGLGAGPSQLGAQLRHSFVEVNLAVLALNLLPIAPLDGALAWRLFAVLRASDRTLPDLLLGVIWHWALRRRERRSGQGSEQGSVQAEHEAGAPTSPTAPGPARDAASGPSAALDSAYDRARAAHPHHTEGSRQATTGDDMQEDGSPMPPQPSAEAQRELAALLRRMQERAERRRRGH